MDTATFSCSLSLARGRVTLSLFEVGPAICAFGDGSRLLGRKDAKLSLRSASPMEIIRQMLQPHRLLLWRPPDPHDP
jgi:hypothetical protein